MEILRMEAAVYTKGAEVVLMYLVLACSHSMIDSVQTYYMNTVASSILSTRNCCVTIRESGRASILVPNRIGLVDKFKLRNNM
jgi:hypothetical protein